MDEKKPPLKRGRPPGNTGKKRGVRKKPRPWSHRQSLFLARYLTQRGATVAECWAYAEPTATPGQCHARGHVFLARPDVKEYTAQRIAGPLEQLGLTPDRIMEEWAHVGLLDPAECFDDKGNMLPIKDMPVGVRAAISGLDIEQQRTTYTDGGETRVESSVAKLRFSPKLKALEDAARHLRMFVDVIELKKGDPLANLNDVELAEAKEKIQARLLQIRERKVD